MRPPVYLYVYRESKRYRDKGYKSIFIYVNVYNYIYIYVNVSVTSRHLPLLINSTQASIDLGLNEATPHTP